MEKNVAGHERRSRNCIAEQFDGRLRSGLRDINVQI